MATTAIQRQNRYAAGPSPSGLADVLDLILDKGLVIDAYVRVAVIGIELITIDARIVIASVDTYLRFAEAVNRLDLVQTGNQKGLPDLLSSGIERGAEGKTRGAIEGAEGKGREALDRAKDKGEEAYENVKEKARR